MAVVLGAFGAHALKARLAPELLAVYHTAVQYHFWHALALLGVALAWPHLADHAWLRAAGWLFVAGLLLFCGSLYALALGAPRQLGVVTPIGGAALILGWLAFAAAALRG
ncbi:MAG TPA: DUF423 domain-containing protein [Burkholderiales bacterium]|jgi:uncharacterized membrane protein YgdD (TMEM256/DUF423 family)